MLFVYYSAVVLVCKRIVSVLLSYLLLYRPDKLILYRALAKDIIGRNACLTAVKVLSENYSFCGELDISALIDYTGAFTAKLKHSGRKMLCRLTQHLFTYPLTSGKEYHIKFLIEKRRVFRSSPRNHRDVFGIKAFLYYLLYYRARGWRIGARLYYYGIACGYGVGKRIYRKQKRVVPWAHYKHVSVRHGLPKAFGAELRERSTHSFCFRVFSDVL